MNRSTILALLVGLAIGCVSTRALQGASDQRGDVAVAVAALKSAQAEALANLEQSLQSPAQAVLDALDEEAKPYFAKGQYETIKTLRASRGPCGSKARCEAIVAKRLAFLALPGIYSASGDEWARHEVMLERDGRFSITPRLESGGSGTWEWKDGAVVLKSERGWVKQFQLAPQLVTKGTTLRWHEELAE